MDPLEKYFTQIRHHPLLENLPIWRLARPAYNALIQLLYSRHGVKRVINGADAIRLHPKWRGVPEIYEPLVWKHLMTNVRAGDTVVDVGAFIGLYTVILAKRVGPHGRVIAFEPDPSNFRWLQQHVLLNGVKNGVELLQAAVGTSNGQVFFEAERDSESTVSKESTGGIAVQMLTLDSVFSKRGISLLKIDVEGYEEAVLKGGMVLLQDGSRCPRTIYIEVHPYAWEQTRTTSRSILSLLEECRYRVSTLDGDPVRRVDRYGEIVASKHPQH